MIQNPVFFVYNVIMSSIVYAIVLSQATQSHVSRKSQRLIHERVTFSQLWVEVTLTLFIGKIRQRVQPLRNTITVSDEGRTLEMSASKFLMMANLNYQLSC